MNTVIVMPAYNEESTIVYALEDLRKEGHNNVIIVDDASTDNTRYKADEFIHNNSIHGTRISHEQNKGLGASLKIGIYQALIDPTNDIIVTFDSDRQMRASDIKHLIKPIQDRKADFVVGSRFIGDTSQMGTARKLGLLTLNWLCRKLFNVPTTDSQSGLRAMTRQAAQQISLKEQRMAVSSEFIKEIGRLKLRYAEVPIKAIYTDYSTAKGQQLIAGIKLIIQTILMRFKK